MKQSKITLLIYLGKVATNLAFVLYLIFVSYSSDFNKDIFYFILFADIIVSIGLLFNYRKSMKSIPLYYFFDAFVSIVVYLNLMSHIATGFVIQTILFALFAPLSGYKLFKKVNADRNISQFK